MSMLPAAGAPDVSHLGSGPERRDPYADAVYWGLPGREPSVEEIVHDPIVQLVMRRDSLSLAQIMATVTKARVRLRDALSSTISGSRS